MFFEKLKLPDKHKMAMAMIVIMIKVGGNFSWPVCYHFKDAKLGADDVGQTLILQKVPCFPVDETCS